MAIVRTNGLEELYLSLDKLAACPDDVKTEMLAAAGEEVAAKIKEKGEEMSVYDTDQEYPNEHLLDTIRPDPPVISPHVAYVVVGAHGTRKRAKKRTRNQEIAFVTEYGKSRTVAKPFISEGSRAAEKPAADAAQEIYDNWAESIGL